jgi:hypothetical protein
MSLFKSGKAGLKRLIRILFTRLVLSCPFVLCTNDNWDILYLTGISLSLCGRGDGEARSPVLFWKELCSPLSNIAL